MGNGYMPENPCHSRAATVSEEHCTLEEQAAMVLQLQCSKRCQKLCLKKEHFVWDKRMHVDLAL